MTKAISTLVATLVIVGVVFLSGCGSNSSTITPANESSNTPANGSPETVVREFAEALGRSRTEAKEYCTAHGKEALDTIEEGPIQVSVVSFGEPEYLEGIRTSDDAAPLTNSTLETGNKVKICDLPASVVWESYDKEYTFRLVDDGSGWKVDDFNTSGMFSDILPFEYELEKHV